MARAALSFCNNMGDWRIGIIRYDRFREFLTISIVSSIL